MTRATIAAVVVVLASTLALPARADEPEPLRPPEPAPPVETTPLPPPEPVRPSPPKKPPPAVAIAIDGGWALRELFSLPAGGGAARATVDVRVAPRIAVWAGPTVFLGSTDDGLRVRSLTMSAGGDVVLDRFRIGAGAGAMWLGVLRATSDTVIPTWGPLLVAAARLDVVRADGFTLFARAALEGSVELRSRELIGGPMLGAGFDFDVAGKREAFR